MLENARSNMDIGIITKRPFKVVACFITLVAFFVNIFTYDLAWAARTPSELTGVCSDRAGSPGLLKELNVKTFILPEYLGHVKYSWASSNRQTGKPANNHPYPGRPL